MARAAQETLYVMQDGADFYIYRDAECEKLSTTWTYPGRVRDFDMDAAAKARTSFEAQLKIANYLWEWC